MTNGNYVGRFGDTLRRLTALQAQQGAFAEPQQIGGADTASAFSAPAPTPMQAPPDIVPTGMTPDAGAGSGLADVPAPVAAPEAMNESGAGALEAAPTSWKDFAKALPAKAKRHIADTIESKVGDLKAAYAHATAKEGIEPRPHASRTHMAMFLAEIALRSAANRGTSASNGEALAKGVLQTQDRRTALAMDEQERQRQAAETQRLEGRADTKEERVYGRNRADAETDHARNREEALADDKRNHEQALELERLRLAAEKSRAKGQNVKIVVDDQGNYQLIDLDTKQAVPVTEDVEETTPVKGSRGKGTTGGDTKKVRKSVKAAPKGNASGLDQDTIQRMISDRIKALADKDRTFRKKTPEEQSKIATELVMNEVQAVKGTSDNTGTAKTIDFNDL